ncbi:MAG: NTP transferase domain-containing protein [Myxococcales bacterium]|jgi:spore coat polysaccharide biosynthesis protein SpsF|nr:NTP transferase domain-containing protein [Myxococcales bacterium]
MRRVAIIQARTGSSRLPRKVLADVAGAPMLRRVIDRARRARRIDDVVVATTTEGADDAVAELARAAGVGCFRGSETDVLGRYAAAAREARADLVVRLTADCPLVDPAVIDRVVSALERDPSSDYASTELPTPTFPRGLDVEALFADVLFRVERMATSRPAREHVTWFIYGEAPALFRARGVSDSEDNSDLRWTVDTEADLALVRALYAALDLDARPVPHGAIVAHVRSHASLAAINAHVRQRDPRVVEEP